LEWYYKICWSSDMMLPAS